MSDLSISANFGKLFGLGKSFCWSKITEQKIFRERERELQQCISITYVWHSTYVTYIPDEVALRDVAHALVLILATASPRVDVVI